MLFLWTILSCILTINAQDDPYLWLEEVEGEKSLEICSPTKRGHFGY